MLLLNPFTGLKWIVRAARHAGPGYLVPEFRLGLWKGFHHLFCISSLMWWTSKSTIQLVKRSFIPRWKGALSLKSYAFISFHDSALTTLSENTTAPILQLSHIKCTAFYDHTYWKSSRKSTIWWLSSSITQNKMLAVFCSMVHLSFFELCI